VEAVQVEYDPEKTSYADLLKIFWEIHNPAERNRQGPDVGPQYQAVIFTHTDTQKDQAERSKRDVAKELRGDVAPRFRSMRPSIPRRPTTRITTLGTQTSPTAKTL
ncbi:MAG: peptide-methionine (S)-S-oxide reductase, partial [Candidatus Yanofskybacteria bacterium]|nr:peptide-methionine (S)-S-oxide reductase [Candidatus Yanofskybacteria bacterium]